MNPLRIKTLFFSAFLFIISAQVMAQGKDCDYHGLNKPSDQPHIFNPRILDQHGKFKFNVEIKDCNSLYFTAIDSKENIYCSKKRNGKWSKIQIASFSDPNYSDADPFLNREANSLYFISERPTSASDKKLDWNIWYVSLEKGQWSKPTPLPFPINREESDEYFFSISDKGNAFFSSNRTGGEGSFDIYTTKLLGHNKFSKPKNVGQPISTEKYEFDPYISADERYIIFSINENGNSSLYYSYKNKEDEWVEAKSMGNKINVSSQDFAPSLSADGKFIFYSNNGKLKWVSSEILGLQKAK